MRPSTLSDAGLDPSPSRWRLGLLSSALDVALGVGVITMDSPPVNSLGTELVLSFKQEFPKLVADPKARP